MQCERGRGWLRAGLRAGRRHSPGLSGTVSKWQLSSSAERARGRAPAPRTRTTTLCTSRYRWFMPSMKASEKPPLAACTSSSTTLCGDAARAMLFTAATSTPTANTSFS